MFPLKLGEHLLIKTLWLISKNVELFIMHAMSNDEKKLFKILNIVEQNRTDSAPLNNNQHVERQKN